MNLCIQLHSEVESIKNRAITDMINYETVSNTLELKLVN